MKKPEIIPHSGCALLTRRAIDGLGATPVSELAAPAYGLGTLDPTPPRRPTAVFQIPAGRVVRHRQSGSRARCLPDQNTTSGNRRGRASEIAVTHRRWYAGGP